MGACPLRLPMIVASRLHSPGVLSQPAMHLWAQLPRAGRLAGPVGPLQGRLVWTGVLDQVGRQLVSTLTGWPSTELPQGSSCKSGACGAPVEVLHVRGQLLDESGARDDHATRHWRADELMACAGHPASPWARVQAKPCLTPRQTHVLRTNARQATGMAASMLAACNRARVLCAGHAPAADALRGPPETETEPMGLRKVTMGARLTKGICARTRRRQLLLLPRCLTVTARDAAVHRWGL